MKNYHIIFLGPQSSGKGTQVDLLADKLKLLVISVGAILREEIEKKTAIGNKVDDFVLKGKLVPEAIIEKLLKKKVLKHRAGFIIDGYPRQLGQAKFLDKLTRIDLVFLLTLSDREAIKRISGRRTCKCGEVYHLLYKKPKKTGICDTCGKKLFIREDDRPILIKRRLQLYRQEIKKISTYYQKQKNLIKIDARPPIAKIHQLILKKINDYAKK